MKEISLWARSHKWKARISIVLILILLNCLGFVTGHLLRQLDILLSTIFLMSLIGVYLSAICLYPTKHEKGTRFSRQQFYIRQKTCDIVLAASAFGMAIFFGNQPEKIFTASSLQATVINPSTSKKDSATGFKTIKEFSASMKDANGKYLKWKERRKLLRDQLRNIKEAKGLSAADRAVLTVLCIAAALLLSYLIAGLSCELSCSGADAAALMVLLGGSALVIFLSVLAFRAIYKGKRKQGKGTVSPEAGS